MLFSWLLTILSFLDTGMKESALCEKDLKAGLKEVVHPVISWSWWPAHQQYFGAIWDIQKTRWTKFSKLELHKRALPCENSTCEMLWL